jgi:hypothetical protein
MHAYHEEAPVLARPADVPDRLRPLLGRAVDEGVEVDDGDAGAGVGSGMLAVICTRIRGVVSRCSRHRYWAVQGLVRRRFWSEQGEAEAGAGRLPWRPRVLLHPLKKGEDDSRTRS